MPIMDGLEATRRIREFERDSLLTNKGIDINEYHIIIGVTAACDLETMIEGRKIGIDDFMPKPFTPDIFEERIFRMTSVKKSVLRRVWQNLIK